MSETMIRREVPNNTINYTLFGDENQLELYFREGKTQSCAKPNIPMEITTGSYIVTNEKGGKPKRFKNGKLIDCEVKESSVGKLLDELDKKNGRDEL